MNKQFSCHGQKHSWDAEGPFVGSNSGKAVWWEEDRVVGNCQDSAARVGSSAGVLNQALLGNVSQLAHPLLQPQRINLILHSLRAWVEVGEAGAGWRFTFLPF